MALRRRGKLAFLRSLPAQARVLDVGCGNNSPRDAKILRPDLVYHGIDVADYNQEAADTYADSYVLTSPQTFAQAIESREGQMDAVVSSHNLEHCDDPQAVLGAMVRALRPGGRLYLAFPCEESVAFPRRRGTLNFHDDTTHQTVPAWHAVLARLAADSVEIEFQRKRYRPPVLASIGLLLEPLGWLAGRNMPGGSTWALYGFESVIWARCATMPGGAAGASPGLPASSQAHRSSPSLDHLGSSPPQE